MRAAHTFQARSESAYRRHIAVVTETYPPEVNGVALTLGHLVQGLRQMGHEVTLVRPRQPVDRHDPGHDSAATLVLGVPLPVYRDLRAGLPSGGALRRLWQKRRPDVVYVATEGPLGWSAVRAARSLGITVFSGFHTNFHSYLKHYHIGWLRCFVLRYLRWFHDRADGTLVPSLELRKQLHDLGITNVSILGRGVDSELFHPRRRSTALRHAWGVTEEDLVVLCVGRVAPEKNLGLAVEAYRAMRRDAPSMKLLVVGDGPLRAALQEKYPEIIFCGVQTGATLAAHYASADIFLFPSETETFGNVTLEAMASGLAVVAYDYAAARNHITDGESGVLAPYGDSRSFVESAVGLSSARGSLAQIRRRARAHAVAVDWQCVVARFAALLLSSAEPGADAEENIGTIEAAAMGYQVAGTAD